MHYGGNLPYRLIRTITKKDKDGNPRKYRYIVERTYLPGGKIKEKILAPATEENLKKYGLTTKVKIPRHLAEEIRKLGHNLDEFVVEAVTKKIKEYKKAAAQK